MKLFIYTYICFMIIINVISASKMHLKFHFVTYNVGTSSPDEDLHKLLKLTPDLRSENSQFDFYIIGLQEVKAQIQNMLLDAIFEDPWTNAVKSILELRDFVKVKTIRLQGILLNVFCLRKHLLHLHNIETQYTRTGLGGMWGNKGAVSIRFVLYHSSICFVNAHLTAHDHMQEERIEDYHTIMKENKFSPKVAISILGHDFVFWFGDLNFRLMEEATSTPEHVAQQISRNQLSCLYEHDQLNNARTIGAAFSEFTEQTPKFKPTFKYVVGTSEYDMKRRPAWTDRIMYRLKKKDQANGELKFEQLSYRSHDGYTMSDHKPVSSNFLIPVHSWTDEAAVKFSPILVWKIDKENQVEYSSNTDIEISFEDWIGVYKDDFSSLDDYKEYMYVRNGSPSTQRCETIADDKNNPEMSQREQRELPQTNIVTFPDTSLHSPGMYRLIYFGVQDGSTSILGMSESFPARKQD